MCNILRCCSQKVFRVQGSRVLSIPLTIWLGQAFSGLWSLFIYIFVVFYMCHTCQLVKKEWDLNVGSTLNFECRWIQKGSLVLLSWSLGIGDTCISSPWNLSECKGNTWRKCFRTTVINYRIWEFEGPYTLFPCIGLHAKLTFGFTLFLFHFMHGVLICLILLKAFLFVSLLLFLCHFLSSV